MAYLASAQCFGYGTARLLKMRTIIEAAVSDILLEISEIILNILLLDIAHHFYFKRSKAGGIGNICIIADIEKLNMACGVLTSAQLFAYLTYFQR